MGFTCMDLLNRKRLFCAKRIYLRAPLAQGIWAILPNLLQASPWIGTTHEIFEMAGTLDFPYLSHQISFRSIGHSDGREKFINNG
jgi:hypothetical protein